MKRFIALVLGCLLVVYLVDKTSRTVEEHIHSTLREYTYAMLDGPPKLEIPPKLLNILTLPVVPPAAPITYEIMTSPWRATAPAIAPQRKRKKYYPIPKRVAMRGIEREGIGYNDGYATLECLFGPRDLPGLFVPLIDLRGHHLYNDAYAANAGFVGRYIVGSRPKIFGANVYYDYRQGCFGDYHQLGLGFEVLGPKYDLRLNGSIPLSRFYHSKKCLFDEYTGPYYIRFEKTGMAFRVYNMEAGCYLMKSPNFILYLAGGPYYLSSPGKQQALGAKVRLRTQYNDYFSIELSTSHDRLFHQIFQAEVTVSLPLYQIGSQKKKNPSFARQLYQPVQRFEIIPQQCECGFEKNF